MNAADIGFRDFQTPCLLVDLAVVRHNLATMTRLLGGDVSRWRPHVKTCKIPEVLDLLLQAGVRHFKCATTREADVLLDRASAPIDLLVAMAHQGRNLRRVADVAAAHARHRVSLLTEDERHAAEVRSLAPSLGLFVDLDPEWGRSGIPLHDHARIAATSAAAGSALRGFHCYEGQLRGDEAARRAGCRAVYDRLLATLAGLPKATADLELVTSGTPAFPFALEDERLQRRHHRVSPGTVVYWDDTSEGFGPAGFAPAVHVLATVISARTDRVTCDAGSKALDAAAGDPCAIVVGFPHLQARRPSEEHLPLERVAAGALPSPGTQLRLIPRHVCPTVNLADEAVLLDGPRVVGVVPVRARGHEVRGG